MTRIIVNRAGQLRREKVGMTDRRILWIVAAIFATLIAFGCFAKYVLPKQTPVRTEQEKSIRENKDKLGREY